MRGLKYLSGEAVGISSTDEIIETLYIDKAIAERAVEKLVRQKLLVIENGVYFVPVASLDAIRVRL
jgi:DNA-binding MarR family transcriptional regulator